MAQLVQGDVAQGDVLLQLGGAGNPVAQALGEDQGVVAQAQGVLGDVLAGLGGAAADRRGDVLRAQGVAGGDARGAGRGAAAAGTRDADGDVAVAARFCRRCFRVWCSQVLHALALGVIRGVPVVLALGGLEERALGVRIAGGDGVGRDHPDGHALVAAGVEVAGVAQGHGGVRGVQGTGVDVGEAAAGPDKDFPERPDVAGNRVAGGSLRR